MTLANLELLQPPTLKVPLSSSISLKNCYYVFVWQRRALFRGKFQEISAIMLFSFVNTPSSFFKIFPED
jgi:hypothetical protein